MTDEDYMRLALQEAEVAKSQNNLPSATIIVKDGLVIARGISNVAPDLDPSGHGDIISIRAACKKLNTLDLSECTLYSVIEPCAMCLTCMAWASISRIVFGAYSKDIEENSYLIQDYSAQKFAHSLKTYNDTEMEIVGGVLEEEGKAIMKNIKNWIPK